MDLCQCIIPITLELVTVILLLAKIKVNYVFKLFKSVI